jgi:uncharacterized membrane protein
MLRTVAILVLAALSAGAVAGAGEPKVDPQTGLIRLLYMGDALMEAGFVTPLIQMDPMITMTPVPVEFVTGQFPSIALAARGLRMYFPRVKRQVTEGYDVVIISDAREPFFPPNIQNWIKEGVQDYGLGFLMSGGPQSFGGYEPWGHPSWADSPIGDILPVICLQDWRYESRTYHFVVPEEHTDHPLVRNIPWKRIPLFCRNRVQAKPGSTTVGEMDDYPAGSPILTYMDMGEGMSEAFVFDWGGNGPQDFHRWSYAPIVLSNMIYYVARVTIPEDTVMFMKLRNQIMSYFSMRRYVLSVIDFAEKFGANMNKAEVALKESDDDRKEVVSLYIGGEYPEALETLATALDNLDRVSGLAMDAKDQALLWVYVIEWLTVSGTGMLCGAILWTLMVRRSAYREVGVTRFDTR